MALDALQLALEPAQAGGGVVVLVARIGEESPHHVERLAELVEVPAQATEPRLDLLGVALDPQPAQPQHDDPQVGVEGIGRDRHHPPGQRVGGRRVLLAVVPDDDLVVDVLGRDVHEGEVEGALVREDVLLGDLVDPVLDVAQERAPQRAALVLVGLLEDASEVLQGELRVDRNDALADADGRVDPVAGGERVLQRVLLPREHLGEEVLEERLPHPAADLGRLEQLLEARDVPPHVEDALGHLAQLAEAPLHRAHHLAHVLELLLDAAADLAHLLGHVARELVQLLLHGGERLAPGLVGLRPRGLDVALEQEQRLVRLLPGRLERAEPRHRAPEGPRGHPEQQREGRHHDPHPPRGHGAALRRPRQWRHTGRSRHGAHTIASRRSRHWPDIRVWQSEKSYFTGSAGSSSRSPLVISSVIFQFRLRRRVRPSERAMFSMWVSTGMRSAAGGISVQSPKSGASRRTIQRRKSSIRLQAPPVDGRGNQ